VAGAAADADDEAIVSRFAGDIVRLATGKSLVIAEFNTSKVTVWRVRPDSCGTPRVWRESRALDLLQAWGMLDEPALAAYIRPGEGDRMVVARTGRATEGFEAGRDADRAFDVAREAYQQAWAFRSAASVDDLLEEATARVPLASSVWYELVLLRRTRSGRVEFTAQQLFLPGAQRDETRTFTVRCEPSDENGTVFAVAARNAELDFQLLSMKSSRIQPGTYTVTATLSRPGSVRFTGLPAPVRDDPRSWLDILAVVPERFDVAGPAHLIVAVEVCGTPDELRERADRARQFVREAAAGADSPVRFSLLSYGAHTYDRRIPDEPVMPLAWAEADPDVVDQRLERLGARVPARSGHARAAAVECLVADVARRLRPYEEAAAGRPVLVMIGKRPASPHRVDQVSRIFPCPLRNDWRADLRGLSETHAGMAFGAIRDGADDDEDLFGDDPTDEVWRMLGTDAYARADVFNPREFTIELGLRSPGQQHLPFPLLVPEGAD
jgi:hypothetical protein